MLLSLPVWFPLLLFILASSVCKCLECLISTLTQGGKGGHLFRLTCSVVLRGGKNTANKHWPVWGVLAVYAPHWVCPSSRWPVLSQSTLLRIQVALQGNCPKQALRFVPSPGPSSSGDQVLGECTVPGGPFILISSLVLVPWFPGCTVRAPSQVCHVSLLGG